MRVQYAVMTLLHGYLTPHRMRLFDTEAQAEEHILTNCRDLAYARMLIVQKVFIPTAEAEPEVPRSGAV